LCQIPKHTNGWRHKTEIVTGFCVANCGQLDHHRDDSLDAAVVAIQWMIREENLNFHVSNQYHNNKRHNFIPVVSTFLVEINMVLMAPGVKIQKNDLVTAQMNCH